ncbi:glycosyltransferase [Erythrobacter sp. BLCC-B19]|uniref:glycosyltransferase n=1 Tax=Erythrobacter sp. BLCC-B19 TaxID=3025315 RepID=UPI002362639C|nr:glycosyltransferase [Erythrobacter sp. BLCC-B19]WDA41810.1 glycosyltransferase [Erythrobacter sp. BLCC-B19]
MSRFLPDAASPPVSVVINTLNRADLLDDAITGVMQLDYPAFELVVVNGPSTDHSEEVLARWQGRIKHLRCAEANLSVSRNVGIAAASGDIVAFLDDDAVPHPLWLRYLAKAFADPAVGGAGGFTVDNTGQRWQVRKTVCDRFGNAYFPPDSFDERVFNWPGTPLYPSLLGTNSSFRRDALAAIGGFDHTFAYLLDETDVCLRLVDAGWSVVYEPAALIFHQFAASHIRSSTRKAKTLYPSVVSKTYFINHHGRAEGYGKVAQALQDYCEELRRANAWLEEHGEISPHHRQALDSDVEAGTEAGMEAVSRARLEGKRCGDLAAHGALEAGAFLPSSQPPPLRVALVSQGLPPDNEAGIARWTMLLAEGLRDQGVAVHIITRAKDLPSRRFVGGIWYHSIAAAPDEAEALAAAYQVPRAGVAEWMAAVMREIAFLKTFGLDLVSFPIWDLEALPVLDDPEVATVLSLHTSYRLARPFKPEWSARVIYGRSFVEPMIAAETRALRQAPHILANSQAVIGQIEDEYAVTLDGRAQIVPHGTPDILARLGMALEDKLARLKRGDPLRVLFAGRFEPRKGHDLAFRVAARFKSDGRLRFEFVGALPDAALTAQIAEDFGRENRLVFHGEVERGTLEALYAAADVVLMPSRFESFGLVAIEAMSAATPVLALASGGLAEVVEDGVSGFLFAGEEAFVAGAAARLSALATDRAGLAALAASSHAAFQARFSDEVMARDVAQFYRAIIAKRGGVDV